MPTLTPVDYDPFYEATGADKQSYQPTAKLIAKTLFDVAPLPFKPSIAALSNLSGMKDAFIEGVNKSGAAGLKSMGEALENMYVPEGAVSYNDAGEYLDKDGKVLPNQRRPNILPVTQAAEPGKGWFGSNYEGAMPAMADVWNTLGGAGGKATLGAGPSLRPALKYMDKIYKAKQGEQHLDAIPAELRATFEKQAMSGEDISNFNFGFINHKGHFLQREDALKYAIDHGILDPNDAKYGTLVTTMLNKSGGEGKIASQIANANKDWKVKGFEDAEWFHGTTHEFDKFSKSKGNVENHLGKFPHFSSSAQDAGANYAGMGPDLTSRVERRTEELFDKARDKYPNGEVGDDYGKVMSKAKRQAIDELVGSHEGAIIPAKMKLDNPVSLVDSKPTWIDFAPKTDKDGEWIKENPNTFKLLNALKKQGEKYGFDGQKVFDDINEKAELYDSVRASDLNKALRESDYLIDAQDAKGNLANHHVISEVFKALGFDGIVMDAKAAFPHMKDIPEGTLHAVPLKQNTVKGKYSDKILYNQSGAEGRLASQAANAIEDLKAPAFYSAVENAVKNLNQSKASGEQWLGTLTNQKGVKGEEIEWTGLKEFLAGKKNVTKQEIENYLKENSVNIKDVWKGSKQNNPLSETEKLELQELGTRMQNSASALSDADFNRLRELNSRNNNHIPGDMAAATKYHSYQLPGGENYRELLMTLPDQKYETLIKNLNEAEKNYTKAVNIYQSFPGNATHGDNPHYPQVVETRKILRELEREKAALNSTPYKSSHWDEPNILAHMRMNDRNIDGKKSLHLEEIQSDWHQQGREKGYRDEKPIKAYEEYAKDLRERAKARWYAEAENLNIPKEKADQIRAKTLPDDLPIHQVAKYMDEEKILNENWAKRQAAATNVVPDAPFKKTWHELALKRAIREAAENGYERLSWTPGEAQAARYDLSKQLKELQYLKHEDGTYEIAGVTSKGDGFNHPEKVTAAKLPDIVGKEMAEKIIKNEGKRNRGQPSNGGYFEGVDLKVGGEGMKGFYDQIIPKSVEKIAKEFGVKVQKQNLKNTDKYKIQRTGDEHDEASGNSVFHIFKNGTFDKTFKTRKEAEDFVNNVKGEPIFYIDIPDNMRKAVMQKGQPLFSGTPVLIPVDYDPFKEEQK